MRCVKTARQNRVLKQADQRDAENVVMRETETAGADEEAGRT
jgi:hypothetical protein